MTRKANKRNIIVWIILSFLFIFFMSLMLSAGQSVSYDFSKTETPGKWRFFNTRPSITNNGLKIHANKTSLMLISEENIQNKSWQEPSKSAHSEMLVWLNSRVRVPNHQSRGHTLSVL